MNQAELNRAVARATGETVSTIKRLGFVLADPAGEPDTATDDDQVIDCDELESERQAQNTWRPDDVPVLTEAIT